jgi:hypothetical protein
MKRFAALIALVLWSASVQADTPQEILERYADLAKTEDSGFDGFSAERGEKLYHQKGVVIPVVGYVSCASCHLPDPRLEIVAHKSKILCRACHVINDEEHPHPDKAKVRTIGPLAASTNSKRFTDQKVVEEFLRVNCRLVFKRECTTMEKGDVLAWLVSVH